jgi:hypothetical protein
LDGRLKIVVGFLLKQALLECRCQLIGRGGGQLRLQNPEGERE